VLITVPSTLLVVLLGSLAAHALAWIDFGGPDVVFVVVISLIVVPIQVAIIPDAALFKDLGVYGEIPAVVAFHVAFGLPFAIFLLRNFFIGIPRDLIEAARMDGASWVICSSMAAWLISASAAWTASSVLAGWWLTLCFPRTSSVQVRRHVHIHAEHL
jgi:ABC-type spermidine/putrescine transport system permease subunit II